MNIVFIIDQVYLHGGIERVLSIKANYLCKMKGYNVHILTTEQQGRTPCYDFDSKINWNSNSQVIYNKIRAVARPYPMAFFLLNDETKYIDKIKYAEQ